MKILIVSDNDANYLAKCHEAFKTGLRRMFEVRDFGKGLPFFDSHLTSFQDIINKMYPGSQPDILLTYFGFESLKFDFEGINMLDVPSATVLGDFWNVTEDQEKKDKFLEFLEHGRLSMVLSYFPQPLNYFADTSFADRFCFMPPSFDPSIFNDWQMVKRFDVGFLAAGVTNPDTNFYPERNIIHQKLLCQNHLKYLSAHHPGWQTHLPDHPLVGAGFSKAINSCRLFITTSGKYRNPHAKYVEILASKSVLLADRPEGAEALHLVDGVNYIQISPDDVLDKIGYYLSHPDMCDQIAEEGYQTAMQYHTCYRRALDFYLEFQKFASQDFFRDRAWQPQPEVTKEQLEWERSFNAYLNGAYQPSQLSDSSASKGIFEDNNNPKKIVTPGELTMERRYWQNWDHRDASKRIDDYWVASEDDWRETLVKDIKSEFGEKSQILEVGCGSSLIYQKMQMYQIVDSQSYIGGDVSQNMLAIAHQRSPRVPFLCLDIFNLPFKDQAYENIICIHVIQHLPHYLDALRELIRITRKKLYIVSWFKTEKEDDLVFSNPSEQWDHQSFYNNTYDLSQFIDQLRTIGGNRIRNIHTHHFGGQNYSICAPLDNIKNSDLIQTERIDFDEIFYLKRYSDVSAAVQAGMFNSGWEHFMRLGQYEGRLPSPSASQISILETQVNDFVQEAEQNIQGGNFSVAREKLQNALSLVPDNVKLIVSYGNVLQRLGEIEAARQQYIKASVLSPNYLPVYINLASLHLQLGNNNEAIHCIQMALQINPNDQKLQQYLRVLSG